MRNLGWWLFAIAGCGMGGHENGMSMSAYGRAFDAHVADLREATEAHGMRIAEMGEMGEMSGEEARHMSDADEHLGGMAHEMGHMGMCEDDDGRMADVSSMEEMHGACEDEMDAHQAAMAAAGDVDAAHAEEMRHQSAMTEWLDGMGAMTGEMMDMDGMYHCRDDDSAGMHD